MPHPAAASDRQTGEAAASVAEPLRVTATRNLSFGTLVSAPGGPGTVSVDAATGRILHTGSVQPIYSNDCQCGGHPASFTVTGESGRIYSVSLPLKLTLTGEMAGDQLQIHSLATNIPSGRSGSATGRLDARGEGLFMVGGDLTIPARSSPGRYRSNLTVTVLYY